MQLLGSVRRGAQVGALAITEDGQYIQVVGDLINPLNRSQLDQAVAKAKGDGRRAPQRAATPRPSAAPVVVVVKRRRVVSLHQG